MSRNFELLTSMKPESFQHHAPASAYFSPISSVAGGENVQHGDLQMRELVKRVFLPTNGIPMRQVVFFGADKGSNSSYVCAAAGRILSSAACKRVCLVDGDPASARLYSTLGVKSGPHEAHEDAAANDICVKLGPGLWLARLRDFHDLEGELPSGEDRRQIFHALAGQFDYVLIDAPPAQASRDALDLAALVDGSILVLEAHRTHKSSARLVKNMCDAAGINLLGTVLDNRTFPIPERLYHLF